MYEKEAKVLTKLADTVCQNVTSVSQLLTILQSEDTITDIDVQDIESCGPTYKRVRQLIVILKTKRLEEKQITRGVKRPFEAFCFALSQIGQGWVAEKLKAELKSTSAPAADLANRGVHIDTINGGEPRTYVAHGNINFYGKD